jgi:Protein of unknown function (DUF2877)
VQARTIGELVVARVGEGRHTGVVRGGGRSAAFIDFDGFVLGVTAPDIPLMPNGLELENGGADRSARPTRSWLAPGTPAVIMPGSLTAGGHTITWSDRSTYVWRSGLSVDGPAPTVRQRGGAILAACGVRPTVDPVALARELVVLVDDRATNALTGLLRSLRTRDPELAGTAAEGLVGRGPGLTPVGDDLITAVAGVVAGVAQAVGWSGDEHACWLAAIRALPLRVATTALSATLIELALEGHVIEPMHRLLAIGRDDADPWRLALRALECVGSSTGKAYSIATGAAALMCTA